MICLRPDLKDERNNKEFKDDLNSLVTKDWLGLNPKVYSHSHQSIQDKHEKQLKDKLVDIQVERPQFYNVISKVGDATDEHQLTMKSKKTLKGVSKCVVKNEITHEDYEHVFNTHIPLKTTVTSTRSSNHNVVTFRTEKVALTSLYDKMCMTDANTCVPFGYIKQ